MRNRKGSRRYRNMHWQWAGLLLLCSLSRSVAQEFPRKDINVDQFIQALFAQQDDENVNYEDVYESLFQLYTRPLDLNAATRAELAATYILSEAQLNAFVTYREKNGKLISDYELQSIPGFDLPTIYRLLPFVEIAKRDVKADGRTLLKRILAEPNQYFLLRYDQVLEQKKGFSPPDTTPGSSSQRYKGSPGRMYARYRVSHSKDFSVGFTLEKDAGEQIIWQPSTHRFGADFISFHALLENKGHWKRMAIGDYQLHAGQGLLLSAGFAVGKGAETVTTVRRNTLGAKPYTSVLESGFLRGATATYELGQFDLTGFLSRNRRDASLVQDVDSVSDESENFVQSIQTSGFHRTPREIAAKGTIREQVAGADMLYHSKDQNLQLGATLLSTTFSTPLYRQPTDYNQFEFNGQHNLNLGLNYNYLWQNLNLFGEIARSQSGGIGLASGVIASLTPKVEMAMLYRHYDRNFHTFYGNAFGENSRTINETGLYWGIKAMPIRKITCNAYYDQFRFPWLKYRVDAPSQGYEYLIRVAYQPAKTILLYAQYRQETKEINQKDNITPIDFLTPATRKNYILNLDYGALKFLTLQSRVQWSSYRQSNSRTQGYALIQDVQLDLGRLSLSTRFALFDTDDYENRQYVYEKDVLYAFSIPAYYERGTRHYLLLHYALSKHLDLWTRFARTGLRNVDTMGSGLEEINAPRRSEVKVQVRYKL